MRFGYMPSFEEDLFSEIEFAKRHFDFLELTLELKKKYNIKKINALTKNFEILGHMHWELNLNKKEDIKKILKFIDIYKKLKIKKLTIHPSLDENLDLNTLRENNEKALIEILNSCNSKNIELLVENDSRKPFSKFEEIKNLIDKVNGLKFTFDVGHSILSGEFEKLVKLKPEHIHLHSVVNKKDHSPFKDETKLKKILKKIKSKTFTLEIFENKKTMLEQLRICKRFSSE